MSYDFGAAALKIWPYFTNTLYLLVYRKLPEKETVIFYDNLIRKKVEFGKESECEISRQDIYKRGREKGGFW